MRKLFLSAALASSVMLGGCATTGTPTPDQFAAFVEQVRAITAQGCSFVPVAQDIALVVAAGEFTVPFAVANAICAAVLRPRAPGQKRSSTVVVSGVVVHGRFVR